MNAVWTDRGRRLAVLASGSLARLVAEDLRVRLDGAVSAESVVAALRRADQRVGREANDEWDAGASVIVLWIAGGDAWIAHVGGCGAVLLRERNVARLVVRHTLENEPRLFGATKPRKLDEILTNAIVGRLQGIDLTAVPVKAGDRIVLSSNDAAASVEKMAAEELEAWIAAEPPERARVVVVDIDA